MWWIALAIAVPFLFIIGTTYSAIKEQKRLEEGALKDVLSERQKKRLEHYKLKSGQKKSDKRTDPVPSDASESFVAKEVLGRRDPVNKNLSHEKQQAILKIDALIDSLDNKHDDKELPDLSPDCADKSITCDLKDSISDSESEDTSQSADDADADIYSMDTSASSIQKSLDEALSFVEDDKKL